MMTPAADATGDQWDAAVPVLMYHSVAVCATAKFRRFTVDPGEFAAQLDFLRDGGYRSVTAADYVNAGPGQEHRPERRIVLTFDDAYRDFYTTALPLLRHVGFTATLFVPTAFVGGTARWLRPVGEADRPLLSWNALRDVATEGVEIAAHSHSHPEMDLLRKQALESQTALPRRLLEDHLATDIPGFAYPFGYWDRAARTAVVRAGFSYAFAVGDLRPAPTSDVYALPRLTVNAGLGVAGLARLVAGGAPMYGGRMLPAKRIAWRMIRFGMSVGRTESFGDRAA